MFKAILAASAITLATVAAGTAAPLATAGATVDNGAQSLVVDAQAVVVVRDRDRDRHRHRAHRDRHHKRHIHVHRDRYHGWHRYSARPWNWQTRGCVAAGPVWVCP
jgi:Ni/Co efflux regulator RcnB